MPKFQLAEFIELTSVGPGHFGIYWVDENGVSPGAPEEGIQMTKDGRDVIDLLKAKRLLTLTFPCTPAEFLEWYEATQGTNGVSDFPLAVGFVDLSSMSVGAKARMYGDPARSGLIIAAFELRSSPAGNANWWKQRMRGAKRYGLLEARAAPGRAKQQSAWYPLLIAIWLIEKEYLKRDVVVKALLKHFPDVSTEHL